MTYNQRAATLWLINEARDQCAHFIAAVAVVGLATLLGATMTPASGMAVGFALGLLREITEGGNVVSEGSMTDMAFWALGGLLGGAL